MNPVFIPGKEISLRPLTEDLLAGTYVSWLNDPEICKYNGHHFFPYTDDSAREYIRHVNQSGHDLVLAIFLNQPARHIGNIALQSICWISRTAEFGILLGERDCMGKGYAYEAAVLVLQHGFRDLGLRRVNCGTSAENTAMQKLAVRLGMKEEGRRRLGMFKNGKPVDVIEYGILNEEFSG
jgi:[ribosomal protein S5]-alanine N-acetyltransferase